MKQAIGDALRNATIPTECLLLTEATVDALRSLLPDDLSKLGNKALWLFICQDLSEADGFSVVIRPSSKE